MENSILILVALTLGYGQGIKRKRNKEGKDGGIIQHIKEKFSRKWQIIREQDEKIWQLKERINELEKKKEQRSDTVYTKGSSVDFEKELFSFLLYKPLRIQKCICYLQYVDILNETILGIKEQKYTEYVYKETFKNLSESDHVKSLYKSIKIKDKVFSYDFEAISKYTNEFVQEFDNFNFDITFYEVQKSLLFIMEIFV